MAKQISHQMTYQASLADVAAMLTTPAFRREVCERQGNIRSEVTVVPEGSGTQITIEQVRAAEGIPSFAKKFVGEEIHIVQTERWSTDDAADVTLTIPGKPGDMTGTTRLTDSGGTTTETVELTVKVGIPLVGGKIEGLIADLLLKALKTENAVGREWLARG